MLSGFCMKVEGMVEKLLECSDVEEEDRKGEKR